MTMKAHQPSNKRVHSESADVLSAFAISFILIRNFKTIVLLS